MKERPLLATLALLALGCVSGCINRATATLEPGTNLSTIKSYYVVHQPKDTHDLHNLIRDRLIKDASAVEWRLHLLHADPSLLRTGKLHGDDSEFV